MTTVTLQGILDKIKSATYTLLPNGRTTVCQLTLENGFTVEGDSACVSVENYNRALGEKYAYEKALNNCWQFEGYLLAQKLHEVATRAGLPAAVETVCVALRSDPSYAWTWHCNLTMMAQDAGAERHVADEGSARFLQLLANVDIRQHPHFPRPDPAAAVEQVAQQAFFARNGILRQHGSPK